LVEGKSEARLVNAFRTPVRHWRSAVAVARTRGVDDGWSSAGKTRVEILAVTPPASS
jgi:hypothetical protein